MTQYRSSFVLEEAAGFVFGGLAGAVIAPATLLGGAYIYEQVNGLNDPTSGRPAIMIASLIAIPVAVIGAVIGAPLGSIIGETLFNSDSSYYNENSSYGNYNHQHPTSTDYISYVACSVEKLVLLGSGNLLEATNLHCDEYLTGSF